MARSESPPRMMNTDHTTGDRRGVPDLAPPRNLRPAARQTAAAPETATHPSHGGTKPLGPAPSTNACSQALGD